VRATLFHNPGAGDGSTTADQLRSILAEAGYQVRYQSTEKDWSSALDAPADVIVVAGGDGTVAKVAKALAGSDTPLAVLPFGTANNIAKALGVFGDMDAVIASWKGDATRALDVGVAVGPFGEERFIESIGAGLFARLVGQGSDAVNDGGEMVHRETDRALEVLRAMLDDAPIGTWQVSLDDLDLSGRYIGVEVMNIGFIGPNVPIAGEADIADGMFDVVLLRVEDRERLRAYVVGRLESASALMPSLDVRRGSRLRITPPVGWPIRIDDDLLDLPDDGERSVDILIRPRAVRLAGPKRAPKR
jgi:diacylglycerol kinase (ATP)